MCKSVMGEVSRRMDAVVEHEVYLQFFLQIAKSCNVRGKVVTSRKSKMLKNVELEYPGPPVSKIDTFTMPNLVLRALSP